jgi:hypothetical protein
MANENDKKKKPKQFFRPVAAFPVAPIHKVVLSGAFLATRPPARLPPIDGQERRNGRGVPACSVVSGGGYPNVFLVGGLFRGEKEAGKRLCQLHLFPRILLFIRGRALAWRGWRARAEQRGKEAASFSPPPRFAFPLCLLLRFFPSFGVLSQSFFGVFGRFRVCFSGPPPRRLFPGRGVCLRCPEVAKKPGFPLSLRGGAFLVVKGGGRKGRS